MELIEKIVYQIKNNNLDNFDYDFVLFQLCVLNNKPFNEMKEVLDELLSSGKITLKNEKIDPVKMSEDASRDESGLFQEAVEEAHLILSRKEGN